MQEQDCVGHFERAVFRELWFLRSGTGVEGGLELVSEGFSVRRRVG